MTGVLRTSDVLSSNLDYNHQMGGTTGWAVAAHSHMSKLTPNQNIRIAHQVLVGGLIAAALVRLPGVTIDPAKEQPFTAPVRIGETTTDGGDALSLPADHCKEERLIQLNGRCFRLTNGPI